MIMILMRMSWAKVGIGAPARKCTGNGAVGAEDCIPGHLLHTPYSYIPPYPQMGPTVLSDGTHPSPSDYLYCRGQSLLDQATIPDEDNLAGG